MTNEQFKILLELFNNYNDAFNALPSRYLDAFYEKLYSKL